MIRTGSDKTDLVNHLKALRPLVTIDSLTGNYGLSEAGSRVANLLLLEEAVMSLGRLNFRKKEK